VIFYLACGPTGVFQLNILYHFVKLSLTTQERKKITEAWLDNKAHFEHMIFHIGAGNLRDSQELVRENNSNIIYSLA